MRHWVCSVAIGMRLLPALPEVRIGAIHSVLIAQWRRELDMRAVRGGKIRSPYKNADHCQAQHPPRHACLIGPRHASAGGMIRNSHQHRRGNNEISRILHNDRKRRAQQDMRLALMITLFGKRARRAFFCRRWC